MQRSRTFLVCIFRSNVYFRSPQEISVWGDDLYKPFDISVWICILSTIFLLSGMLKMTLKWEQSIQNKKKIAFEATNVSKTFGESVFILALGAYSQQGTKNQTKNSN